MQSKRLITSMIIVVMLFTSACGKHKEEDKDEVLLTPEYETSQLKPALQFDDKKSDLKEGYYKFSLSETDYVYIPYIENKIPGVSYFYEDMEAGYDEDINIGINRPEGAKYVRQKSNGFFESFNSKPEFDLAKDETQMLNPLSFMIQGYDTHTNEDFGDSYMDKVFDFTVSHPEIQCVTMALYEEFYKKVPELTVKTYGVTEGVWNSYLGDDMRFTFREYYGMLEDIEKNKYSKCELIGEKKIEGSGAYYIDYNSFEDKGYKQVLVVFEYSESCPYTYNIDGCGTYEVIENQEEQYKEWKIKNKDKFLAG